MASMSPQGQTTTGWIVFIAALGMMFSLVAIDISQLPAWMDAAKPVFVGTMMGHLAAVIAAFVGGKLIPEQRSGQFTRASDIPAQEPPKP